MTGMLTHPDPLYARLKEAGRLLAESVATSSSSRTSFPKDGAPAAL
jgi:hypothetical protein